MPETPYPDAATVEAVMREDNNNGGLYSAGWFGSVEGILAAARRVEQEQAKARFSREFYGDVRAWVVRSVSSDGDGFRLSVADIAQDGTVRWLAQHITPADLRALAAYVEGLEWGAPGQETGA